MKTNLLLLLFAFLSMLTWGQTKLEQPYDTVKHIRAGKFTRTYFNSGDFLINTNQANFYFNKPLKYQDGNIQSAAVTSTLFSNWNSAYNLSHAHNNLPLLQSITADDTTRWGQGGGGTWGSITGTLSDQTDLQSAINAKQNQLNGTGFIKASGTTISYDNSTYLTTTGNGSDLTGITATQVGAEPQLGNPASDGYILSSTADGVRSWLAGSLTGVINIKSYGAIGDSTTDDSQAFRDAIAAVSAGSTIILPEGNYLISSTVNITKSVNFLGLGGKIKITVNDTIFNIKASDVSFNNILFRGSSPNSTQNALYISAVYRISVLNCSFISFGANAIYAKNININPGISVVNSNFTGNACGIFFDDRGEYSQVNSCFFSGNTWAMKINGANNIVQACNIISNTNGVWLNASSNEGHGIVIGCNINHNSYYGVRAESLRYGETFDGCHIYQNKIYVKNSTYIKFNNCTLAGDSIIFDAVTKSCVNSCYISDEYSLKIIQRNGTVVDWANNIFNTETIRRDDLGGKTHNVAQTGTTLDWGKSLLQTRTLTGSTAITSITNPILGSKLRFQVTGAGYDFNLVDNYNYQGMYYPNAVNIYELECIDTLRTSVKITGKITQPDYLFNDSTWYNTTSNASVSGSFISKVGTDDNLWNCSGTLPTVFTTDGTLQFKYLGGMANGIIGLTTSNPALTSTYTSINFGIYVFGTTLYKTELGVISASIGTVATGNLLRIKITGTTVTYEKSIDNGQNWTVLNTSATAATFPLYVDCSIRSLSTFYNVIASLQPGPTLSPAFTLADNSTDSIAVGNKKINRQIDLKYTIQRGTDYKTGYLTILNTRTGLAVLRRDSVQTADIGVSLTNAFYSGSSNLIKVKWVTSLTGAPAYLHLEAYRKNY